MQGGHGAPNKKASRTRPTYTVCFWWHRLSSLCIEGGGRGRPPYHMAPDPCFLTPDSCFSNRPVVPVVILVIVIEGPDFI
jgi:hypothetical protein